MNEIMFQKQKELAKEKPFLNTEMGQYAFQLGFEHGYKSTIDKACVWLEANRDHSLIGCEDPCLSGYLTSAFIEDFRKAMKGG